MGVPSAIKVISQAHSGGEGEGLRKTPKEVLIHGFSTSLGVYVRGSESYRRGLHNALGIRYSDTVFQSYLYPTHKIRCYNRDEG